MKEVQLTKGFVALVDDEDYEAVSRYKWGVLKSGNVTYAKAYIGKVDGKYTYMYLHRFILSPDKTINVDHVNGDGLDNRRVNLRTCTQSQNACNRRIRNKRSGLPKGVAFDSSPKNWKAPYKARIVTGGVSHYLGGFTTADVAAAAYSAAAKKFHGGFSCTI